MKHAARIILSTAGIGLALFTIIAALDASVGAAAMGLAAMSAYALFELASLDATPRPVRRAHSVAVRNRTSECEPVAGFPDDPCARRAA